MQGYDITLKLLLQSSPNALLRQLTGVNITQWLNIELPQVRISRADLLGATEDGSLVHIELQVSNDPEMALRMAQYALSIYTQSGQYPSQVVLYVGEQPPRMPSSFIQPDTANPKMVFHYTLVNIRDLDPAALLASSHIEDNLLAILTNFHDQAAVVHQILERVVNLVESARPAALAQLLLISGLRHLAPTIKQEVQKMPILNDLLEHEVFGPVILQGRQEGLKEGLQEGLEKGMRKGREKGLKEGSQKILRRLLEQRFGALPQSMERRLAGLSAAQLDEIVPRIFQISSLDELFPQT